jgi:hypothetical protein
MFTNLQENGLLPTAVPGPPTNIIKSKILWKIEVETRNAKDY